MSLRWTVITGIGILGTISGLAMTLVYSPIFTYNPDIQLAFMGIGLFIASVLIALGGIGKLVSY